MKPLRDKLRNPKCKECELHKTAQSPCLIGDGPWPCELMFIGEAPGFREDDVNKPFAGKAGQVLDAVLGQLGINRTEVYITNVVHCRPPDNRKPSMDEIRACRHYLKEEIKHVNPKTIVVLGDTALKGLFNSNLLSIGKERGKILDYKGRRVVVTYHPAAALRNPYFGNLLGGDLARGLSGKKVEKEDNNYRLVDSENRKWVMDYLNRKPYLGIDVETTGLDMFDQDKKLVSINTSIEPGISYVWKAEDIDYIKKIIENKELLINHNIKFDLKWLHRYGIKVRCRIFDTMVAKHILDENYPDKELKHLARLELGMHDLSEAEKIMIQHRKNETMPSWKELVRYGGGDSDAVIRLFLKYSKELIKQNLDELMRAEMRVLKSLTNMEIVGVKIDKQAHKELSSEYRELIHTKERKMRRIVGEDINFNSPQQLAKLLYKKLKLPVLKYTDDKKKRDNPEKEKTPSCDEDTLTKLSSLRDIDSDTRKLLKQLLGYKRAEKLYSTYLDGLDIKSDGKIHGHFNICGTKTGRLSSSEPNLQNIPRDGDIKRMFVSQWPKGYIIQLDYSQMELRILAHYSNDKKLIQAFKEGRDIHKETTSKCLHKPYDEVTEDERKIIGKRVNFGIVYMIGAKGLSERIECSEKTAQKFIDNWFKEFSMVRFWMQQRRQDIIDTGKSVSFNGRIRRLHGVDPTTAKGREAVRQGVNSPVQGGAGDITKYNMARVDRRLRKLGMKSRVTINVHDAIIVDSPDKEEVRECIKVMNELCIEPPIPLRVPLAFEIKVGKNWNELKEVTSGKR